MSVYPLLLLHGALGNKEQFDPLLPMLSGDFVVHTLDFSGHGTKVLDEYSFGVERFGEDVINYLDEQSIEKTDIFGYSMGGYVAMYLSLTHPDRINRIFTLGTKVLWNEADAQIESARLDPDKMLSKVPAFVEELQQRHKLTPWEQLVEKTAEMMIELGADNLLTDEELTSVRHDIRIAVGDRDLMVSVEEAAHVYRCLTKAQLQVFPGTPHPIERAPLKDLVSSIRDFFLKP